MVTLEELATRVDELERRVAKLRDDGEAQDRFNARLLSMVEEVRDDVSVLRADVTLLRRHAVATGQKLEELDARMSKLDSRMSALEGNFLTMSARMDRLDANFTAFQRNLPAMITETVREVLKERDTKLVELMRAMMDERDRRR